MTAIGVVMDKDEFVHQQHLLRIHCYCSEAMVPTTVPYSGWKPVTVSAIGGLGVLLHVHQVTHLRMRFINRSVIPRLLIIYFGEM